MNVVARNESLIGMNELADLEMLKEHIIYSDEFTELTKERQSEIYNYCKCHATHRACIENLKQIRYAVTKVYFGW